MYASFKFYSWCVVLLGGLFCTSAMSLAASPNDLVINVPGAQTVTMGAITKINGVSISDPWANTHAGTMALNLTTQQGTVILQGSNYGTGAHISGTLAQLNAALAGFSYTNAFSGNDVITVNVWNQAGVQATETIAVTISTAPIANDLVVNVPGAQTVTAGTATAIAGISISDPWAASNPGSMALNVTDNSGSLAMNGTNDGTGAHINGTMAQLNADLASLSYTGVSVGNDVITVNVWNQAGVQATETIAVTVQSSQTPPPPGNIPTDTTGVMATPSLKLLKTFGMNTHIDFGGTGYGNLASFENSLVYLWQNSGASPLLRDCPQQSSDLVVFPQVGLATKAQFLGYIGEMSPDSYQANLDNIQSLAANNAGLIMGIEGPDEADSAVANGLVPGMTQQQALQASANFMPTVQSTANQLGLPVFNMSYGQGWCSSYDPTCQHGNYGINGDLSAYVTYGNAHTYPINDLSPDTNDYITMINNAAKRAAATRPVAITEFGYSLTTPANTSVNGNQTTQAVYALEGFLDAYNLGNVYFFWYAMFDDISGDWGWFNANYSPRPAAVAFHNLMGLLGDTGANAAGFAAGKLNYSLSGMPLGVSPSTGGQQLLLQKTDGSFWLLLWNEQNLNNGPVANVNVGLTLGTQATSITVYDALSGAVTQSASNTNTMTISLPSHLVLVKIVRP